MEDRPIRILIVEDNPDHTELMGRVLSEHYPLLELDSTASGELCLAMMEEKDYDVVLLDYTLPKLDGSEVLKRINDRGYCSPVIMVTGQGDERIAVEAMKLGTCDYITKSGDYLITLPFVVQRSIEQYSIMKEKERLDQEIKETKEYLENFLENANDIIYTLDMDGKIRYINQTIEKYSIMRKDLLGKEFFALLPGKQPKKKFKDSIMKGTKQKFEMSFKNKNGEKTFLLVHTSPLKDEKGMVTGISGIARDVTETKLLEQKHHEMEIELMEQHKLSSIGTLVQGIAHNMNSPLTGISGRAQLLEKRLKVQKDQLISLWKGKGGKELDETLEAHDKSIKDAVAIEDNVDRLAGIIRNMMYKSWQEQTEEFQMISINELLKEELAFLEADMFFKHDIKKKYAFSDSIPYIKAIYSDFSQSIINVVRNALDAMHNSKKRELTVTTSLAKGHICIDIHDTGEGIQEENISKIFDPFFTTKPSNSSDGAPTGIGLGLHSSYILLKRYGVRIDVVSEPGNTKFTLKIPFKKLKLTSQEPKNHEVISLHDFRQS